MCVCLFVALSLSLSLQIMLLLAYEFTKQMRTKGLVMYKKSKEFKLLKFHTCLLSC